MDMRNMSFDEDSFDVIWANASFLHVPKTDVQEVVQDFYRLLRKQRIIFLSIKKQIPNPREHHTIHELYTEKELSEMLEKGNFIIESIVEVK